MSLTKLEENLSIIENLPDAPTMESTELKQKFDEGSIKIKDYINETLTVEIDNIVTQIKKEISNKLLEDNKKKYYVGKLIFDTKNVNPATYLGFGTWQLWGSGRVPVGVDISQTEFNTVEKTGGEKTHKLTVGELASHTHTFTGNATGSSGAHTHTLNGHTHSFSATTGNNSVGHTHSIPAHSHGLNSHTHSFSGNTGNRITPSNSTNTIFGNGVGWVGGHNGGIAMAKNDSSYSCNAWSDKDNEHRHSFSGTTGAASGSTANSSTLTSGGISTNHTHNVSGTTGANSSNTTSNGAHTHTISGTNSNTGSNTAHNNLQPYITCYIWKRVS